MTRVGFSAPCARRLLLYSRRALCVHYATTVDVLFFDAVIAAIRKRANRA